MNSGLHRKSFEDATELAKQATIEMQQWLSEDIAAWDAEEPPKRQKTRHGDEPKRRHPPHKGGCEACG